MDYNVSLFRPSNATVEVCTFRPRRNLSTNSRCSAVSGTAQPRAFCTRSHACSRGMPKTMSKELASRDERPIPARQWTATDLPSFNCIATCPTNFVYSTGFVGTARSSIGKLRYSIPQRRQSVCSFSNSSSDISTLVSRETRVCTPEFWNLLISSPSQSPPRGRDAMANRSEFALSIQ